MQAFNPYLPDWEYIPDGEPRIFGDKLYIFGSHDEFGAPEACINDYVCWWAPKDDPRQWHFSGVIYRKDQDPLNGDGSHRLFAPDVVQGPDGRYYLYYGFDFSGIMGVAVCDIPDGEYQFLDHIHYPGGVRWGSREGDEFPYDPGVLVDGERVYLFSGFAIGQPFIDRCAPGLVTSGGVGMELEKDMCTIKGEVKLLFPYPDPDENSLFKGHEFFEASSIRRIGDEYVFVYSSQNGHELCYATAAQPLGPYRFRGTLVDQGDLYLQGNEDDRYARNYLGNTHGGLVQMGGDWYIFYHRQTNQDGNSRQACAERLQRDEAGGFLQAEVTSCGLNPGPLEGWGEYSARIACNLWSREGTGYYYRDEFQLVKERHPYFTQRLFPGEEMPRQYIANMRDGATAGFKYFAMDGAEKISVSYDGCCRGKIQVSVSDDFSALCACIPVETEGEQKAAAASLRIPQGRQALYFRYIGDGYMNFYSFRLGE